MLKAAPPLFTESPTEMGEPTSIGIDMAAYGVETDPDCWAIANRITNEVIDAGTLAEIEDIKVRNASDIRDLLARRRDLAMTVSTIFTDRRKALGGGAI